MRDLKQDFEDDFEQFATSLAWSDRIAYLATLPLLVLLAWWLLQQ